MIPKAQRLLASDQPRVVALIDETNSCEKIIIREVKIYMKPIPMRSRLSRIYTV